MKKSFTFLIPIVGMLVTASVFMPQQASAQVPEKLSYQAVIRNASNSLVISHSVGMRISILQGAASGTAVYVETQTASTNANGLVTIEIGTGSTSNNFSLIDWAHGPYFIKTETDPAGGTNYSITGTSQLLSVPYALHAKTAESLTTVTTETDPAVSANFNFSGAVTGDLLKFNGTKWVKFTPTYISNYTVTQNDVTGHQGALQITKSQITDLGTYLQAETDPRVPTGTAPGEMQYWNGSAWITVAPPSREGQFLSISNGEPVWLTLVGVTAVEVGLTDAYNPTTGKVWMDRNLGASQVAASITDANAYGHLYEWGRGADGHQLRTSGNTTTLSTTDVPGHGNFINGVSTPFDWRSPQNNNLWQGLNGTNNPCPAGYRLPTEAEWTAERLSWSTNNAAGAFASSLKMTMGGYRDGASIGAVGIGGLYWISTVSGTEAKFLDISSGLVQIVQAKRSYGFSVRCIKD